MSQLLNRECMTYRTCRLSCVQKVTNTGLDVSAHCKGQQYQPGLVAVVVNFSGSGVVVVHVGMSFVSTEAWSVWRLSINASTTNMHSLPATAEISQMHR